ncbi:MAG: T9SS type A sorting domain-containing protein [Cytophagaceae bacterium]|jgi:hypothetical protein|nr:T9SS type A sorting domain-containing protein [Cytophagaceae bacterium]
MKNLYYSLFWLVILSVTNGQTPQQISLSIDHPSYCVPFMDPPPEYLELSNLESGRSYRVFIESEMIEEFEAGSTSYQVDLIIPILSNELLDQGFETIYKNWCAQNSYDIHVQALNDDEINWTDMLDRDTLKISNPYVPGNFCRVTSSAPVCSTGTYQFTFHQVSAGERFSFLKTSYVGSGSDIVISVMMDTVALNSVSFPNMLYVVRNSDCGNCGYMGKTTFPQKIFDVNCTDLELSTDDAQSTQRILLYPSIVNSDLYWKNNVGIGQVTVSDVLGRVLLQIPLQTSEGKISLADWKPDIYVVRMVLSDGSSQTTRIFKQ